MNELHLSLNDYKSVDVPPDLCYPSLHKLNFNANLVSDWAEIAKLGRLFPNLEHLVLMECKFTSFGAASEIAATFPKLTILNVNKTQINDWSEIDKLREFPALGDVRLVGIPFFEVLREMPYST